MPGGKVVYVPLHPPPNGAFETSSASEWKVDVKELERAITPRTRMIVRIGGIVENTEVLS
jgi:kynurenine aminotransferase